MGKSVRFRRRTRARLYCTLYPTNDLRPTISPIYQKKLNQTKRNRTLERKTHFENPVRLYGVNAQAGKLPTAHDLAPIPDRTRARPQRAVRSQDGAERRRRLETFGGVDVFEDLARHGQVVLDWLLIRWMDRL
jgi:hypothetical protein